MGNILDSNTTCAAIDCSTWTGMSGRPICVLSTDEQSLVFCGVYNGSDALPFQVLIEKILFRL